MLIIPQTSFLNLISSTVNFNHKKLSYLVQKLQFWWLVFCGRECIKSLTRILIKIQEGIFHYLLIFVCAAVGDKFIALFDYSALNDDEVSFKKDDVITIISKDEQAWWKGELNGKVGLFPSNYLEALCK